MTLRETLNNLPKEERDSLFVAFNNEDSLMIRLPENQFIGVHVKPVPGIKITEQAGYWSLGEFTG